MAFSTATTIAKGNLHRIADDIIQKGARDSKIITKARKAEVVCNRVNTCN